jgi:glycosyltransferase involved in cell wall biosynthesis
MCTDLIAYTATEASALATLHPGKRILVAFNSLYSADALSAFEVPELHERTDLLIIGRLVPEKKATLGIEGFALAAAKLPDEVTLHVVGSGQEGAEARSRLEGTPLLDRVRFHGQVSELADLAPIFLRCRALLAPGYIGLNATQALGFGLVVVYARDELHAPEIEALNDSNSMAFDSDDADACAEAIIDLFAQEARFDAHEIAAHARKTYTTDRMVDPFVELARYE